MRFTVEIEQETDGRWIAEVLDVPGALSYSLTPEDAANRARKLARRVWEDEAQS